MSSITRDVLVAIRDGLAADLGAYDFSATGRVQVGGFDAPPIGGAFIALMPGPITTQDGHSLREWGARGSVVISVWVPSASVSASDRMFGAIDAASEVMARLWTIMVGTPVAPFATSAVYNQQVSVAFHLGEEIDAVFGGWGVAAIEVGYDIAPTAGVI